ncbi:hypothetical protein [Lyngbya sp. CCAP 1446/10]|uniref:hypothetical protein n=1 Tax=Lyngbya sp. CCAP 1446/10 TaxID=439293 RepID=UPI002AA2B6FC|nr:hypothetical protein [Lyngbya sp. CCAP 1446/10]
MENTSRPIAVSSFPTSRSPISSPVYRTQQNSQQKRRYQNLSSFSTIANLATPADSHPHRAIASIPVISPKGRSNQYPPLIRSGDFSQRAIESIPAIDPLRDLYRDTALPCPD